jgi:recombinational DNA repair protein (RecF pathway)
MYLADATFHAVLDHDPHAGLFDALAAGLAGLERADECELGLVRFQWALLTEIGLQPRLFAEAGAEPNTRRITEDFDPRDGGVVVADETSPARAGVWRVRRETLDALRALDSGAPLVADQPTLERAGRLLAAYLMFALDRDLATARAVFGDHLPSTASPARRPN